MSSMPTHAAAVSSHADWGLICGYAIGSGHKPREISVEEVDAWLSTRDSVVWLHLNLGDARTRRWLGEATRLPPALRELLKERSEDRLITTADDGLLLVMSDFTFEESDPSEVATLWCYAEQHLLVTARLHPVKSADELRLQLRDHSAATSGLGLLVELFEIRTSRLRRLVADMTGQLDRVEDEILAGSIRAHREQLGRMRRLCARLRRQFAPERTDVAKFLRTDTTMAEPDREVLHAANDGLGFAIEDLAEHYERAKLLQEELASRLAENTGRNLYVLSILTAVLLPMTLVTGIFGMNVAGLPGLHSPGAFWQVMLLIIASGGATLAALIWRRLL